MTTEKQNKLLGICASLGLHGLAAAVLIFGVSGAAVIPRDLGRLDFVWVSIAARDKTSFSPAREDSSPPAEPTTIQSGQTTEISTIQNFHMKPETVAETSEAAADDKTMTLPAYERVAYASAAGHHAVSDAGRPSAVSGAAPAYSNAYPLYKENPPPGYPAMARQQGYEGVVLVQAEILADGRVGKVVVSKSSGYAILDQTAIKAVRGWKFEPAKKSGIPCKTWAELPIKFVLNDNTSQS